MVQGINRTSFPHLSAKIVVLLFTGEKKNTEVY